MEQKNNEDIILIAEFMGWQIEQEGIWAPRIDDSGSERNGLWFCFNEFPIEWNTLMLVVEKIESLKSSQLKRIDPREHMEGKWKIFLQKEGKVIGFWITNKSCSFVPKGLSNTISYPKYSNKNPFIEVLYSLVIELIKWYNGNKENK